MSTDERFSTGEIDAPDFSGLGVLDRFDLADSSEGDDALLEALREHRSIAASTAPDVPVNLSVQFRQALQLLGEDGI